MTYQNQILLKQMPGSLQTVSFAGNQVLSSKTASEIITAPDAQRPTHCHQTQMSVTS